MARFSPDNRLKPGAAQIVSETIVKTMLIVARH
jgi:hypothetical protein